MFAHLGQVFSLSLSDDAQVIGHLALWLTCRPDRHRCSGRRPNASFVHLQSTIWYCYLARFVFVSRIHIVERHAPLVRSMTALVAHSQLFATLLNKNGRKVYNFLNEFFKCPLQSAMAPRLLTTVSSLLNFIQIIIFQFVISALFLSRQGEAFKYSSFVSPVWYRSWVRESRVDLKKILIQIKTWYNYEAVFELWFDCVFLKFQRMVDAALWFDLFLSSSVINFASFFVFFLFLLYFCSFFQVKLSYDTYFEFSIVLQWEL